MDYLKLAQDHASMWSIDRNGKLEFTFDETGLEYFLDSIGVDFTKLKEQENV